MKKSIIAIAALFIGATAYGQGGYASFSVGYGIGFPGEVLGTESKTNPSSFETVEKNIYGTIGNGVGINLTPGIMLNKNFGLELGLSYFSGFETIVSLDELTGFFTSTISAQTSQLRVLPTLVVKTDNDGLNMYSKAGLVVPVIGTTIGVSERNGDGTLLNPNVLVESESKGALSFGYTGTIGASFSLSDNLSVFGELNGVFLRIKSDTRSLTKYTNNGTDVMPTLAEGDKETIFLDEISSSTNTPGNANYDDSKPSEELATRTNFSSVFLNVGLTFKF